MTNSIIDARFLVAKDIIEAAGKLALSYFGDLENLKVDDKINGQDIVSAADKAVEALIRDRLSDNFPDDSVLGEEQGLNAGKNSYIWVVDPIDGTSCFVNGLKDWCISIALLDGNETELGLIYHPLSNELFTAKRARGARLNEKTIKTHPTATLKTGLLGVGANFRIPVYKVTQFVDELLKAGGMFIRSGSGALMLAHVACGRLIGYYEPHINSWDCLAGLLLIREAGGWTGEFPIPDGLLTGYPVIAAAQNVKADLVQLIDRSTLSRVTI